MSEIIWWRDCNYHPPEHLREVLLYYREQDTFFIGYYNHNQRRWFANGVKEPLSKTPDSWAGRPETPPELIPDELPF